MSMNQPPPPKSSREVLKLKRPISVALYDEYADAARAVDYLADRQFPVENLAIVGTDLKSIEKVTGNVTWGKVLLAGFLQGATWAGMFAIFMWLLMPQLSLLNALAIGLAGFGLVGMAMAALQYRMRGRERDYTSTTAIIATHYEVLAEAEVADRARSLLGGGSPYPARSVEAQPSAQSGAAQQDFDLGALPPPFGQQPSVRPGDQPQPGPQAWGGYVQPAPHGAEGYPQPPARSSDMAARPGQQEPAQPTAGEPGDGSQPPTRGAQASSDMPYGQYWGDDEPPGIGDVPKSFEPSKRTEESSQ